MTNKKDEGYGCDRFSALGRDGARTRAMQQRIPPLRCGMTNKSDGNGNGESDGREVSGGADERYCGEVFEALGFYEG
jgi:hypothetical protein